MCLVGAHQGQEAVACLPNSQRRIPAFDDLSLTLVSSFCGKMRVGKIDGKLYSSVITFLE